MTSTGQQFSGSTRSHARLAILLVLAAAMLAMTCTSADAAYIHPEPGYEFGPNGLSTSSFPRGPSPRWTSTSRASTSSSSTSTRPRSTRCTSKVPAPTRRPACPFRSRVAGVGLLHRHRDRQHRGRQRRKPLLLARRRPDPRIHACRPGSPAFAPIGGEKCGVGVDNEGHLWTGNLHHQGNGRVRTDRWRSDQNGRCQRHRIAMSRPVRPLEQRHVCARSTRAKG